jgi:hypothetical protein
MKRTISFALAALAAAMLSTICSVRSGTASRGHRSAGATATIKPAP